MTTTTTYYHQKSRQVEDFNFGRQNGAEWARDCASKRALCKLANADTFDIEIEDDLIDVLGIEDPYLRIDALQEMRGDEPMESVHEVHGFVAGCVEYSQSLRAKTAKTAEASGDGLD